MRDPGSSLTPRRIAVATTVLVLLLVWLVSPVGWCYEERLSVCHCGTTRYEERRRVFSIDGVRVPFSVDQDSLKPSKALVEVFGPAHVHDWAGLSGFAGTGGWGTAWSGGAFSLARRLYENDPEFRNALLEAMAEGKLTHEEGAILLALGAPPFAAQTSAARRREVAGKAHRVLNDAKFDASGTVLRSLANYRDR